MMSESVFEIDRSCIDNLDAIESRLTPVDQDERDALEIALRYLYVTEGPTGISRELKMRAEEQLTPVERFALQWLYKRTDGKLRRHYGSNALKSVKRAGYRCQRCGFSDIRALNLEKPSADSESHQQTEFVCLCANCNTVAARAKEMAAVTAEKEAVRLAAKTEEVKPDAPISELACGPEPEAPME